MAALKVDVDCFQDKCSSDYLRVFLEVCQFISTVIGIIFLYVMEFVRFPSSHHYLKSSIQTKGP